MTQRTPETSMISRFSLLQDLTHANSFLPYFPHINCYLWSDTGLLSERYNVATACPITLLFE